MPIYSYRCDRCNHRAEDVRRIARRRDEWACPECAAGVMQFVLSGGQHYHPTIERLLELERGHLKEYQPPPLKHSSSGAGIRTYPGYTGGEH